MELRLGHYMAGVLRNFHQHVLRMGTEVTELLLSHFLPSITSDQQVSAGGQ